MLMRGDRTVKRGGHRSGSARLSTRQPVSADVNRGGSRIAPIKDDHGLALAPKRTCALAAGKIGDTGLALPPALMRGTKAPRSEEHTSELQSRGHLVCRLLLE